MKKILFIITLVFLLCSCSKKYYYDGNINIESNKINYGDKVNLYDIVSIKNGILLTENYSIDTTKLGEKEIEIKFKDNKNKIHISKLNIKIVDEEKPIILSSNNYYLETGKDEDLTKKIFCGDNYDRNLKCEIIGNYDINKPGTYKLKFNARDINGNKTEKDFNLIIKDKLDNYYDTSSYDINDFIKKYKNSNTMIGIDVSTWQGDIDWKKVKESGVEFAFIRLGYGPDNDKEIVIDNKYDYNLKEAKKAGIKVGLYFYSYATTNDEALKEAKFIINNLNKKKLDLPIAFDWEEWTEFDDYNLNIVDLNKIAKTFLDEIEKNGYQAMLYGSANYLNRIWNINDYPYWLAHYTEKTDFPKKYYVWQIANNGKVSGIDGYVDLDVLYNNY